MKFLSLLCILVITVPNVLSTVHPFPHNGNHDKRLPSLARCNRKTCNKLSQPLNDPSHFPGHIHHGRGTSDADQAKYLALHNDFRAQYGADPLQWNNTLQTAAQEWADRCVFEHSRGAVGPYGENLSAGTDLGIEGAIKMWTDEADEYDPNHPQYSHFTQVVWKSTTQLGCAVAHDCNGIFAGRPADLYVCEYFPPGNVIGHFRDNVGQHKR